MASSGSSSSGYAAALETVPANIGDTGISDATGSQTHQRLAGSTPTEAVNDAGGSESPAMDTSLLVAIIVASAVVFVAVLFMIRSRRRRYKPKLVSPNNIATFQGVTSTTASELRSHPLGATSASTGMNSPPESDFTQTLKLSRLSAKGVPGDHVAVDVHDTNGMQLERITRVSRTTSFINGRSVFAATILGFSASLPSLSVFRASRISRKSGVNGVNEPQSMDTSMSTISLGNTGSTVPSSATRIIPNLEAQERRTGCDAWRDMSDTCWSIGPGSDSETENERFSMPVTSYTQEGEPLSLNHRLSTLSDGTVDIEEEKDDDVNSLDDSSRRRDRMTSSLDELSPQRERCVSMFDDSSPPRVRGLSALDIRPKDTSSVDSYFSIDSDFYDDTIKDCSSNSFDSDSECGSDGSLREKGF